MPPIRLLLLALAATLSLAACVPADQGVVDTRSGSEPTPPPKPPYPEPAPPPQDDEIMKCDARKATWAVGQIADEPMVTRIRTETRSKGVRVIKPGMAVTMDYREDRVNIDVDANNRILTVRCG